MSDISPEEIKHLAQLARLTLTEDETENFKQQLPQILSFIDKVAALSSSSKADFSPRIVEQAQLRVDEINSLSLTHQQLEKLAPKWSKGQLIVPEVFGENADD